MISAAPSAGEQSNGYLHGGLIIDFIGQGAPPPSHPVNQSYVILIPRSRGPDIQVATRVHGCGDPGPAVDHARTSGLETRSG